MALDRQWALDAYAAGWTAREIATECGVAESTVHRALTAAGVERRPQHWGSVLTREFLASVTHLSDIEVAEKAGVITTDDTLRRRSRGAELAREWRAKHGLAEPLDAKTRAELHRLYLDEGLSVVDVASHLGIGKRTARRRLLAAGVPLRGRGRRSA
jgi:Homeodomain-like domain